MNDVEGEEMKRRVMAYLLVFGCASCILRTETSADEKFIALQQERGGLRQNILIDKVHEPRWNIGYSYGDDCLAAQRDNDAVLTAATTEVIQMWLQPLRTYSERAIVDAFRYQLNVAQDASDLVIVFHCEDKISTASITARPPRIDLRSGVQVKHTFKTSLMHEMGHAFGLMDTYVPPDAWGKPGTSKGGLDSTRGTQPESSMAGSTWHKGEHGEILKGVLGQDDKNGVIWLYKVSYEGLSLRDCFFTDYELEHAPLGCRPKYPLIFELKHGIEVRALRMLEEDEKLDVNAQDADGMTALHHAVSNGYEKVVEVLIAHADIKPFLKNKQGQNPLQLAEKLQHDNLAQLIAAHPKALTVDAKDKQVTSWGEIKKDGL